MASTAANFLSTWASERGAPECSTQRFPVGTPHVGQVTEDICLRVSSRFFMVTECDYTQPRICSNLHTAPPSSLKRRCLATVRNGTAWFPSRWHAGSMLQKKGKKELNNSTLVSVKNKMAKPRLAKSARIAERNLDTARISERLVNDPKPDSSFRLPGQVEFRIMIPARQEPFIC